MEFDLTPLVRALNLDTGALARDIGRALISEVQLEFASSTDPYGVKWDPVKRDGQPLLDTGRLRNSFTMQADTQGVRIGSNVVYAKVHQFGSNHEIPARQGTIFFNKKGKFAKKNKRAKNQKSWTGTIGAHRANIKARPMVPLEGRGLGNWERVIKDTVTEWARVNVTTP